MELATPSLTEAFRILPGTGPVVLTCEHASERLVDPYAWPAEDARLIGTHWTHDLGAAELVEAVHALAGWPAVLSRFCRLIADPNRPEDHPDVFRSHADGLPIRLNQGLSPAEREARIARFHRPYHQAIHELVAANPQASILSVHSFTDVYEGQRRTLELGVLFDLDEEVAHGMAEDLSAAGYRVALNEPWSGKEGLVYAPDRHGREQGRRAIELELRQDLLVDPAWRQGVAEAIVRSVRRRLVRTRPPERS